MWWRERIYQFVAPSSGVRYRGTASRGRPGSLEPGDRLDDAPLLTDGGTPHDGDPDEDPDTEGDDDGTDEEPGDDSAGASNVEVVDAGEAEPAEPKWEPPDLDDIPDFEVRADEPVVQGGSEPAMDQRTDAAETPDAALGTNPDATSSDPTAGMPHDARAPGATGVSTEGTEAYLAAIELCARLADDIRLPEEAADLVPAAVEAELEQDVQSFAATEFDNPRPVVDTLAFEEVDDEIWLRLRIGLPREGFEDLDPEAIRTHALQRLEGVF